MLSSFFFWPNYEWMIGCGVELEGHPGSGSLGLTRFLPGNQSPGQGFFFVNIES